MSNDVAQKDLAVPPFEATQNMRDFTEELRLQRVSFADRYAANKDLAEVVRQMDAMFAQDEAEPVISYAERRGD